MIEVPSYKILISLPSTPQIDELAKVTDTGKYYKYTPDGWVEHAPQAFDTGLTMYEVNQMAMTKLPPLDIDEGVSAIVNYLSGSSAKYLMLLSRDINYYTVFARGVGYESAQAAIWECISNLGTPKEITLTEDAYALEIWFTTDTNSHVAYLFDYSEGVIECQ